MEALLKKRAEGKITREQYLAQKKKLTGRTGGNPSGKKSKKNGPPSLPRKNIDAQVYAPNRFAQKANKVKSSGKDSWTPGNVSGALVARTPAGMARCYLASMVDPKNHMCRIPDSFNRKTSLFRSVVTYDYPFVTTGASERFSVALQPIIGDVDTPTHYQLAIVNNANANVTWDENTDWTNAATYCDDLGGTDPRVDINAPYLVNPPVSFGGIKDTWLGTLITSTNWFSPASQGVSPNNVVVTDLNSFRFRGRNSAPADYTRMLVPAGTWMLIIQWTFTPSANAVNVSINTNNGNTATVLQSYRDTLAAVTAGTSYNLTVSYIVSSDGTVNGGSMNQALVVAAGGVLANPTASVTSVWITNTAVSNQSFPSSFGVIEEMRPVSCSVWACCNAPGLVNGGEIAAAYVPKDYLTSNFFANSQNGSGNGQYYETLSKLEGAFNGPFKNGAYAWWSPQDIGSLQFQDVATTNDAQWPALVVSGIFAPLSSLNGTATGVLRIEACFCFEYITKVTAFEQETCLGSQGIIDSANGILGRETTVHAMPNGKHLQFIQSMIRGAGKVGRFVGGAASALEGLF